MTPVDHARLYNHLRLAMQFSIGWPRQFVEIAGVTIGPSRRYLGERSKAQGPWSARPTYSLHTDHWTARLQVDSITGVNHPEFIVTHTERGSDRVACDRGPVTVYTVEGDYERYKHDCTILKMFSHLWEDTDQPHR